MLSLDALIAAVIVTVILFSAFQFSKAQPVSLGQLSLVQLGRDTVAVLEQEGTLDTFSDVQNRLDAILPVSVTMRIERACDNAGTNSTGTLPTRRFIGTGKHFFVISSGGSVTDRCVARWWVWNT